MIGGVMILLSYYCGMFLSHQLSLPIPGPLLGLVILLAVLFFVPNLEKSTTLVALPFLKHMSVLFVPAVLGVSLYWNDIASNSVALFVAIVGTTALCLGLTGWFAGKLMGEGNVIRSDSKNRR
ncbi:CidA/LrgA family protein [Alteromonas hispanica]|uniref:CidA/LrgA family protein n=2 Tax=Alteromonas hispanica TaxID=315421 RepID=A0A6L9MQS9_9ALTE|nr:CidA/LrgA family protein [Alteromonas hispanica]